MTDGGGGVRGEATRPLLSLTADEFQQAVEARGGRPFHARTARRLVLESGVLDYAEMTSLPKELRAELARDIPILAGEEAARSVATDGTTKLLLRFGDATVETVHIPSRKADRGATLCV